jgi:nitroimidazol reductase NimA-like FMN-containing flavoprotein (pyridoxamine 5'-phosphate oxidase superfamily)
MKNSSQIKNLLKELFASQKLAVLATYGDGQPYINLVAFASSADLKRLLFTTKRNTRKYRNLKENPQVAVLIDNRANKLTDFHKATAVTAIGKARESIGSARKQLEKTYLAKHPHLEEFAGSPENALFAVKIEDYVIATFSKVMTLKPD